jgi:hypothetical protein
MMRVINIIMNATHALLFIWHHEINTEVISIYVLSVCSSFAQFYIDLRVWGFLRLLSYAISKILNDNRYFFCIVGMFIVFGAHVFYMTKFYDGHEIAEGYDRNYGWYLYWTFEYLFGNYETWSAKNLAFDYMNIFHVLFAFFFTFLLGNVLVALIQNSYKAIVDDSIYWHTY